MRITSEIRLQDFETWAGATDTKETIIEHGKADDFNMMLEDLYPNGITDVQLNDILWHDTNWVYEVLDINVE